MYDVNCPYCGAEIEICHDDGFGCEEDITYQQECPKCENGFVFTTSISIDHQAYPADCLNGAPHDYNPVITFPKEYSKMRCTMCDEERTPTIEEMASIMK
ncbi:hypothetical protein [Dyadobacter sp. 3J3]|uniref:hypothetical protein n=1 Tax=Dyadobacter sp. 3J3 TaxID=2606600 RepID=UPI001356C1C6|nr:hypothetical protein [Dyadobacter sp. 3J3]